MLASLLMGRLLALSRGFVCDESSLPRRRVNIRSS